MGKNQGLKTHLRQLRIYEIRERGSRGFTEIKLMTLMRFTGLGLRSSSHLGKTLLLGVAIPLGCEGVQEVGYNRWREEKGYGVRWRIESLFSAVRRTFGESVGATSFLGQVVEAKLKFWAYAWMVHLANSLVGRAPGIKVCACE